MISFRQADLLKTLDDKNEVGYAYFNVHTNALDDVRVTIASSDMNDSYKDILAESLSEFGWDADSHELGTDTFVTLPSNDSLQNMFRNLSDYLLRTHRVDMRFENYQTTDGQRFIKVRLEFLD